MTSLIQAWD